MIEDLFWFNWQKINFKVQKNLLLKLFEMILISRKLLTKNATKYQAISNTKLSKKAKMN